MLYTERSDFIQYAAIGKKYSFFVSVNLLILNGQIIFPQKHKLFKPKSKATATLSSLQFN